MMSSAAVTKQIERQMTAIEEPENIQHALARVFQDSQTSLAGHRKQVLLLKSILTRSVELDMSESFFYYFCKLINKVLVVKKTEMVGDRIAKLLSAFITRLREDFEENEEESEEEKVFNRFIQYLIDHLLRGIESRNKDVRYRVVQFLDFTINAVGELENDLTDKLLSALDNRLKDKEQNVRIKALHCIARFQDDGEEGEEGQEVEAKPDKTEVKEESGESQVSSSRSKKRKRSNTDSESSFTANDSNDSEVIEIDDSDSDYFEDVEENKEIVDSCTSRLLFAIQHDSSAEVRRAALLNLVKTPDTLKYLLERAKDTNSINRRLVYSKTMKDIGDFRKVDSRFREKILAWGLKDRDPQVRKACIEMFATDWLRTVEGDLLELLERLKVIDSEIAELAMKEFFEFRRDIVPKISLSPEIWKSLSPETAFLARTFYQHCNDHSLDDLIDANYPEAAELANLLTIYLDSRRLSEDLEDAEELDFVVEQLLLISANYDFSDEIGRRAMLQVIRSSLSNDRLTDKLIKIALRVLKKLSINERDFTAMVAEIITDVRDSGMVDDDEEGVEDHGTDSEGDEAVQTRSKVKEDARSEENEKNIIHSLSICKSMLQLTNEPLKDNLPVTSLFDTLINPAVKNTLSDIRELGTECLALCCLLDSTLAGEQLYLFGLCLTKGHEELKIIAIKAMFDILSVHGTKVLDIEDGVDSLSFHKLLYRTLRDNSLPAVQALCAEGLCKLYLADILKDDDLFETLIIAYYNPANVANQSLQQALTYCLPVYCFSQPAHQQRMASIAHDAFQRLYIAHGEEDGDEDLGTMAEPNKVLMQLLHWTDPINVVNQTNEQIEASNTHVTVGVNLLETLSATDSKKYKRLVMMGLPKLHLGGGVSYEDLKNLKDAIVAKEEMFQNMDQPANNAVKKLLSKLEPLLEESRKRFEEAEQREEAAKDQEFSQILEEHEPEDGSKEEIDEEFEKEQSMILQESEITKKETGRVTDNDAGDDSDDEFDTAGEVPDGLELSDMDEDVDDLSAVVDHDGDTSME